MPTATFSGDFSDFYGACKKAESSLALVQKQTDKVSESTQGMAETFTVSASAVDKQQNSFAQFNDILGAVGIHLGPLPKALGELGSAAGASATSLGLMTTAGLALGVAIGAWKLTTWIQGITGADKATSDWIASTMGWTTAAGGAGSAADTLARATAIAGREITNFNEALKINTDEIKKNQGALFQSVAPERAAAQVKAYHDEIARLAKSGVLESLKKHLEDNDLDQKKLIDDYQVSAGALKILGTELAAHKERVDRINAANEKFIGLQNQIFGGELVAKALEYGRAIGDLGKASQLLPDQMATINTAAIAAADHLSKIGLGASESAKSLRDLALATTDWAAVNAKVAALPDPFVAANDKRRAAFRETLNDQLNLNQGVFDGAAEWMHAGEIADKAMADAAAAAKDTTAEIVTQKAQVDQLAGSYQLVSRSAQEWRGIAAGLAVDAERTKQNAIQGNDAFGNISRYADFLASAGKGASTMADYNAKREAAIGSAMNPGAWGGGGGWTVNVNAMQGINGDQIANEIVAGMRRRGVSPAG